MQVEVYQKLAERTLPDLGEFRDNVQHMLMGIFTEAGELTDAYKKEFAYKKDRNMVNVREEIGDLMWYITNLCTMEDLDLGEIMGQNIAKLQKRYPEKFTQENAIHRDVDNELTVFEEFEPIPEKFIDMTPDKLELGRMDMEDDETQMQYTIDYVIDWLQHHKQKGANSIIFENERESRERGVYGDRIMSLVPSPNKIG